MQQTPLRINQGDFQPYYKFIIEGVDSLSDAVITANMYDSAGNVVITNGVCYITNYATFEAEYRWQAGDTDDLGLFRIIFTITPSAGSPFDLPTAGALVEIVSVSSVEPVTVADVEKQVRTDLTGQEVEVELMISAVREDGESKTRRALIVKTQTLSLSVFPTNRTPIEIPSPPLRSVTSITYLDSSNVEQTFTDFKVLYNTSNPVQPSKIIPTFGNSWPVALDEPDSIQIEYVCGYGSILNDQSVYELVECPKRIKQWMLLNIANLYENRETIQIEERIQMVELKTLGDGMLANYRVYGWK